MSSNYVTEYSTATSKMQSCVTIIFYVGRPRESGAKFYGPN